MLRDALVVGINTYQFLPPLQSPSNDAESVANLLQTHGEFRVQRVPEVIQDGTPRIGRTTSVKFQELETALVKLFKPKGKTVPHTALFYFSGHGIQKDAGISEGYLAVSDANPTMGFYGLSLFWLRRLLQESPVRQRIVILDCCHSGELLNFLEADPGAHAGTDRLFMAASREYEAAYESLSSPHSVLTQALLDGLDPYRSDTGIVTNHSLTGWVSNALKGELQQPLFENSGSEIVLTRRLGSTLMKPRPETSDVCPYRGLEFFDEAHADYFFGRDDITDQLINRLRRNQIAAVVGASGSGKSSLVRAGLISELRRGQKFSGSDRWVIRLITPTESPMKSLAAAFINPQLKELERAEQLRRAEEFLQDGGLGLTQLVRGSLPIEATTTGLNPHGKPRFLLVIDQFEEVFTLCQGSRAEQERRQFFNCLTHALRTTGEYLNIVIALRADFFGKCSLYDGLAQLIEENLVVLSPLNYEQIKATIVRPAEKVGLTCEPNLVYTMLLDVIGAPGELPLLQYTLLELWRKRHIDPQNHSATLTLDAYTDLGGVRGTLQKRATEIFYALLPEEQTVAKRIFLALTQLGEGTEDTRRRVYKSELVSARYPKELVERVLEKLVAAKLIVTNQMRSAKPSVEVSKNKLSGNLASAIKLAHRFQGKPSEQDAIAPFHSTTYSTTTSYSGSLLPTRLQSQLTDVAPSETAPDYSLYSLNQLSHHSLRSGDTQETVDVVHEALIRNWSLLRSWLDESREVIRRQRRIEHAAQEWFRMGQPSGPEYLLRGGQLADAEDFGNHYSDELSELARRFVVLSQEESRRAWRESKLLQLTVPGVLLIALATTFSQYRSADASRAERDYQLQLSTSRERAAIAQTILQNPDSDPTTALLISRLAIEQGEPTEEAQASIREALRSLRLQQDVDLGSAVQQIAFSSTHNTLVAAKDNGEVELWNNINGLVPINSAEATQLLTPQEQNPAETDSLARAIPGDRPAITLSEHGNLMATLAASATSVHVWNLSTGKQVALLEHNQSVNQVEFSRDQQWIVTVADQRTIALWHASTGQLQAQFTSPSLIESVHFSPDSQSLTLLGRGGLVFSWPLSTFLAQPNNPPQQPAFQLNIPFQSAEFSPSGRWLISLNLDGGTTLWDTATGQPQKTFIGDRVLVQQSTLPPGSAANTLPSENEPTSGQSHTPLKAIFNAAETQLAIVNQQGQLHVWNLSTGQLNVEFQLTSLADDTEFSSASFAPMLAFSPNGQFLAGALSASSTQSHELSSVYLWDLEQKKLIAQLRGHKGQITDLEFSANGDFLATAGQDRYLRLWATKPVGEFPELPLGQQPIRWLNFIEATPTQDQSSISSTRSSRFFASAYSSTSKASIRAPTGPLHFTNTNDRLDLTELVATNSRQTLSDDSDTKEGSLSLVLTTNRGSVQQWQLANQFADRDRATTTSIEPINRPATNLWQKLFNPSWLKSTVLRSEVDSQQTAEDNTNQSDTASVTSPSNITTLSLDSSLTAVAFSQDGKWVATAKPNGSVETFQLLSNEAVTSSQKLNNEQQNQLNPIRQLQFSPNAQFLLGITDTNQVYVWDVESGQLVQRLEGHHATIQQAQFSFDGRRIVTASLDKTVRVWQISNGKIVHSFSHPVAVNSASFSFDGQKVVTASQDGSVRIFDLESNAQLFTWVGSQSSLTDAAFSPDGHDVAIATASGQVSLWTVETNVEQVLLPVKTENAVPQPIRQLRFSPNGDYLAALSETGQVSLWVTNIDLLTDLARDRSLRQLTTEECKSYLRIEAEACPRLELGL